MKCKDCRNSYVPSLLGELTAEERRRIEEHLAGCPACARACAGIPGALFAVRRAHEERTIPAIDVWPEVRRRISARPPLFKPHWVLVPVLNLFIIGVFSIRVVHREPVPAQTAVVEWDVIENLDFLSDYEMWEKMELLESAEL